MNNILKKSVFVSAVLSAALLSACGGDGGSDSTDTKQISGVVTAAPVNKAKIYIHKMNDDGSVGEQIAEAVETKDDGSWQAEIPGNVTGPFIVIAKGGSYTDEATNELVTLDEGDELRSVTQEVADKELVAAITPLTHALALLAQKNAEAANINAREAVQQAIESISASDKLGFDPTRTLPTNPSNPSSDASDAQKKYAALLGGMSAVGEEIYDQHRDALANDRSALFDLATKLAADIADGKIDGKDLTGAVIKLRAGNDAPALHNIEQSGIAKLVEAANKFVDETPGYNGLTLPPDLGNILKLPPAMPTSARDGIHNAKTMIASLRTNAYLLSKSDNSGFLDKQADAIESDLKQTEESLNNGMQLSIDYVGNAIEMLRENDAVGTFTDPYAPCLVTVAGAEVVCQWRAEDDQSWVMHQLILTKTVGSESYAWSQGILGYGVYGSESVGASTPTIVRWNHGYEANLSGSRTTLASYGEQTGTATATFNGSRLASLAISGRSNPAMLPTSSHAYDELVINAAYQTPDATTRKITFSGHIAAKNAQNVAILKLAIGDGSFAMDTMAGNVPSRGGKSAKLNLSFETVKYGFSGALDLSNSTDDKVRMGKFSGAITDRVNANIGEFMSGTIELTQDKGKWNPQAAESASNYKAFTLKFDGTVKNGSVTPVGVYQVALQASAVGLGNRTATLTYTDPSKNIVTVNAKKMANNQKTIWVANMGNIYITEDKIYLGSPSAGGEVIGTRSNTLFSFSDGSFESL